MTISTHVPAHIVPPTKTRPDSPAFPTTTRPPSSDHRLALLTARAGLEPELAKRYTSDPVSVLAEFGLASAEPVYGDLYGGADRFLVIEELDRLGGEECSFSVCIVASLPVEDAQAALA